MNGIIYRVKDYPYHPKEFDRLDEARAVAEEVLAWSHNADPVIIESKYVGEDFFEPFASICWENRRFVMKWE